MTDYLPKIAHQLASEPSLADVMAPPVAPMTMPKQVLKPESNVFGALISRVLLLTHRFRRVG